MRKIDRNAANAFENNEDFFSGNTKVFVDSQGYVRMYLFENIIAKNFYWGEEFEITTAGWMSNTTKSRLNALQGVFIQQIKGIWYLNGNEWDGKWIKV